MKAYEHLKLEKKWQKIWEKKKVFQAQNPSTSSGRVKPKYYSLIEFPYPSGDGLHVGHPRPYIGMDVISRKRRLEGFNVLYPIGWDAFGLPTENYAIKTGQDPRVVTKKNSDNFRRQIKSLGISFDWSREVNTTDPKYYKWTQWIFLQFLKKGLAYKARIAINWCPQDKIGLANEEVVGGNCERCGTPVEKREKEQWMLGITKYAERLDKDLDTVDYSPQIKLAQRNWIGKSEGAEIEFHLTPSPSPLENGEGGRRSGEAIKVFTTRPDTIFGATYLVLAPEHELIKKLESLITNRDEVWRYIAISKKKNDLERIAENKEKSGIELKGVKAINPATKEEIPIWIADYVMITYGTGAIMAVPAHDERDYEFARRYQLKSIHVIDPRSVEDIRVDTIYPGFAHAILKGETFTNASKRWQQQELQLVKSGQRCYLGDGELVNSKQFNNFDSEKAKKEIIKFIGGKEKTSFKLRDWVFSRQRYWGEPIPVVFCLSKGSPCSNTWVPVPEKELPVLLPKVKNYQPTDTGESPLAKISKWVNVRCPKCKGKARRETDTMPNWAGSSWYYLRYTDPKNSKVFADKKSLKYWTPIDWYNGGNEHTTLHLLYSRFWHKFLFDLGLVPTSEPYKKRTSHGLILAEGGEKMSKSKGNVINPDDIVKIYGADTLRVYEMFMGPFNQAIAWSEEAIIGPRRFLEKVWRIGERVSKQKNFSGLTLPGVPGGTHTVQNSSIFKLLNKTIKKVSEDIENMRFNTAISSMMIFVNEAEKQGVSKNDFKKFLQILSPFAPHITEELWSRLGEKKSINLSKWPEWDKNLIKDVEIKIAVQVNGKVRAEIVIGAEDAEAEVKSKALADEAVQKHLAGRDIKKTIYIKNRLINIVL